MDVRKDTVVPSDKPVFKDGEQSCGPQRVVNAEQAPIYKNLGCRASGVLAKAASRMESWLKSILGSDGVMAVARREGLYRNWRSPPGPEEKHLGAR